MMETDDRRGRRRGGKTTGKGSPLFGVVFAVLLFAAPAAAAEDKPYPLEPGDTSSPRATLKSFRDACNAAYRYSRDHRRGESADQGEGSMANRILYCLDLSEIPEYMREFAGKEAGVCLKEVLDRIELPPERDIPGAQEIERDDDEPPLKRWTIPHTEITIARVEEGPRQGHYVFSATTVAKAVDYYERVRDLPYQPGASDGFYEWYLTEPRSPAISAFVHSLPEWTRRRVYGQTIWQWTGLAVANIIAFAVMFLAYRAGRWKTGQSRQANLIRYCLSLALPVAAMLVPLLLKNFAEEQLVISGGVLAVTRFSANIVFLFGVLVVLMGAGSRVAEVIISSPKIHPRGVDAQFIRLACRGSSLLAATIVFLEGGQYLGIPLTTLLAGAGVGGLAMALGAQDMLRNLFGSIMIILDKPYRVGERISVKEYDGVVEEIGLRSTKIRLLTGHLAVIPNEEMGRSDIENIGRRPHIRRIMNIAVPLDTPPKKVEKSLRIVRDLLKDHQGMHADFPPRVFFTDYNRDSLNLRIIYWFHPPEYWEFLAYSEELNLRIMREFQAAGIPFALPTNTTIWATQPDVDEERKSPSGLLHRSPGESPQTPDEASAD